MKRSKIKCLCQTVVFLIIGVLLYQEINAVFMEKSTYGKYLNFKDMEDIDVLVLGSSHSDDGIDAIDMEAGFEKNLGKKVNVYNYSIYGMRLEQMYYVLKEILKTQKPEVIVIETFSFVETEPENREILARRAFDYFPLSRNKVEAVTYCTDQEYATYLFPIMKYHTRWKELSSTDFGYRFRKDLWENMGRTCRADKNAMEQEDEYFSQDFSAVTEKQKLGSRAEEKLQDILSIAKEEDIKILFFSIPFKEQLGVNSVESIQMNNYVEASYVDGDRINMLDLNKKIEEIGFGYQYLFNEGHCNQRGAKKITGILMDYMSQRYGELLGGRSK